jgi:hypothetical protein
MLVIHRSSWQRHGFSGQARDDGVTRLVPIYRANREGTALKSYFLEELPDEQQARRSLSALLPGQTEPWLLMAAEDDPLAHFNITILEDDGGLAIQADISGRHYE